MSIGEPSTLSWHIIEHSFAWFFNVKRCERKLHNSVTNHQKMNYKKYCMMYLFGHHICMVIHLHLRICAYPFNVTGLVIVIASCLLSKPSPCSFPYFLALICFYWVPFMWSTPSIKIQYKTWSQGLTKSLLPTSFNKQNQSWISLDYIFIFPKELVTAILMAYQLFGNNENNINIRISSSNKFH